MNIDEQLTNLFAAEPAQGPDMRFKRRVLDRIAAERKRRRWILASATVLGALIALFSLMTGLAPLSEGLSNLLPSAGEAMVSKTTLIWALSAAGLAVWTLFAATSDEV